MTRSPLPACHPRSCTRSFSLLVLAGLLALPALVGCPTPRRGDDDDDDDDSGLVVEELPVALLGEPYAAELVSGEEVALEVVGLPEELTASGTGRITGTPGHAGTYPLSITLDGGDTPVERVLTVDWDRDDAGLYAAARLLPEELNNMAQVPPAFLLNHAWVRLAGVGIDAEVAGDPATVRQLRVGLYRDGFLVGELTDACTFEAVGPYYSRTRAWGGEPIGTTLPAEGRLDAAGVLRADGEPGYGWWRADCGEPDVEVGEARMTTAGGSFQTRELSGWPSRPDGLGGLYGIYQVLTPSWCSGPGCPPG